MPESRDLPPAGYTRATPRPPLRSRLFGARAALVSRGRSPFPAAALALVLAACIVGVIGYGTRREPPARSLRPDAVSPSAPASAASASPPGPSATLPGAGSGVAPDVPAPVPGGPVNTQDDPPGARPGGGPSGTAAPRGSSGDGHAQAGPVHARPSATQPSHRSPRPRPRPRPAPRPHVPSKPRTARPAAPSWIGPECRRRFPGDPARQAACVAALTRYYAK
ncbi:hypothetical protein ABT299_33935 [Spirillospora sp. NPDC000708]